MSKNTDLESVVQSLLRFGKKVCNNETRCMLARAKAEGTLSKIPGADSLVFTISKDTYRLTRSESFVFCCALCDYVGDRFYHAKKHFDRIHLNGGSPMRRKRKYFSTSTIPLENDKKLTPRQRTISKQIKKKGPSHVMEEASQHPERYAFYGDFHEGVAIFHDRIWPKLFGSGKQNDSSPAISVVLTAPPSSPLPELHQEEFFTYSQESSSSIEGEGGEEEDHNVQEQQAMELFGGMLCLV